MKLIAINGGVVFNFESSDPETQIVSIIDSYKLIYVMQGFYIPKPLMYFLFGYYGKKDDNNKIINFYNYFFNNLYRFKLYYDIKEGKVVSFDDASANVLQDGIYIPVYNQRGIIQDYKKIDSYNNEILPLLNQPIHAELLNTIEVLNDEIDFIKEENSTIIQANTKLVNEIKAIKEAINNIATDIKTKPAVNGSPINPALVINLITNKEEEFENQANIYEKLVNDAEEGNNKKRSDNAIKLLTTSNDIKVK